MSATPSTVAVARATERGNLETYRDDGPLARALGRAGAALPVAPWVLPALAAVPLFAVVAARGADVPNGAAAAVVGWAVVAGGLAGGRPDTSALRWTVPPLARAVEYTGLLWIAALAGHSSLPAAYALLAALAFRHYDLVYRLRHRGVAPPDRLGDAALGWDGRLVLAWLLLALGLMPAAYFVLAAVLGVTFAAESALGWARSARPAMAQLYEDEDEED